MPLELNRIFSSLHTLFFRLFAGFCTTTILHISVLKFKSLKAIHLQLGSMQTKLLDSGVWVLRLLSMQMLPKTNLSRCKTTHLVRITHPAKIKSHIKLPLTLTGPRERKKIMEKTNKMKKKLMLRLQTLSELLTSTYSFSLTCSGKLITISSFTLSTTQAPKTFHMKITAGGHSLEFSSLEFSLTSS